jgi:hypothetical protein
MAAARIPARRVPARIDGARSLTRASSLPQGTRGFKQQAPAQPCSAKPSALGASATATAALTFSKKLATPPSVRGGVAFSTYRISSRRSSARSLAEAFPDT